LDIRDYEISLEYDKILKHWERLSCYSQNGNPIPEFLRANSANLKQMYRNICSSKAIHTLATITEYTKNSNLKNVGVGQEKIKVYYPPMKNRVEPGKKTVEIPTRKFALLLNADRFEKNGPAVVRAFDELFNETPGLTEDLTVVVTGITDLDQLGMTIRNRLRFVAVGYLAPETLECLYSQASMLVYASLNEGFGYPPIEIMKYQKPSVVADNTSLPEVCRESAVYCDPYSVDSIKRAISQMFENPIDPKILHNHYAFIAEKQKRDLKSLITLILEPADVSSK